MVNLTSNRLFSQIKSSRVAFTMILGVIIGNKTYNFADYVMVSMLVTGLGIFLHADMTTDAVFNPVGVIMLVSEPLNVQYIYFVARVVMELCILMESFLFVSLYV